MSDLTETEQANVRKALEFLRFRCGSLLMLAKALRLKYSTIQRAVGGHDGISVRVAFRVARLAETSIDGLLAGKWPQPNTCPCCGQRKRAR